MVKFPSSWSPPFCKSNAIPDFGPALSLFRESLIDYDLNFWPRIVSSKTDWGTFFSILLFKSTDLGCFHAKSRTVRFPWTFATCDGQGYRKESNISWRPGSKVVSESPLHYCRKQGQNVLPRAAGVSLAARRGKVFLAENPGLKERLISTIDK